MSVSNTPVAKRSLASALSFAANNYGKPEHDLKGWRSTPRVVSIFERSGLDEKKIEERLLEYLSYAQVGTKYVNDILQIAKHYCRRATPSKQREGINSPFENPVGSLILDLNNNRLAAPRNETFFKASAANPPSPPSKHQRSLLTKLFPSRNPQRDILSRPPEAKAVKTKLELFASILSFLTPAELIGLERVCIGFSRFLKALGAEPKTALQVWSAVCNAALPADMLSINSRTRFLRYKRNKARCILIEGAETDRVACTKAVYDSGKQSGSTMFELGPGGVKGLMTLPKDSTNDWIIPLFSAAKALAPSIIYFPLTEDLVSCSRLSKNTTECALQAEHYFHTLLRLASEDFYDGAQSAPVVLIAYSVADSKAKSLWRHAFGTKLSFPFTNQEGSRELTPGHSKVANQAVCEHFLNRLKTLDHEVTAASVKSILQEQSIDSIDSVDTLISSAAKSFTSRLQRAKHFRKNHTLGKYEICMSTERDSEERSYTSFGLGETRFGPLLLDDFYAHA